MSKRVEQLLKSKELIKEYIVDNLDDLLKLKNGAVKIGEMSGLRLEGSLVCHR